MKSPVPNDRVLVDCQMMTPEFARLLADLKTDLTALWTSSSDAFPDFMRSYTTDEQRSTEEQIRESLWSEREIDPDPDAAALQLQRLKASVRGFVARSMCEELRGETEEMLQEFSDAGDEFIRQARDFDPDLSQEDLFQALRNLWIINSMQVGLGVPVRLTPSSLAYSLLYPYSDNLLDNRNLGMETKRDFQRRFRLRLAGFDVTPVSAHEQKIVDLIGMIEGEYPRRDYPEVYASLLAIHAGQERSLCQQYDSEHLSGSGILDISVEKGGASVLADAFLAKGELQREEAEFAFGYGVFLQLIDDLQDTAEDLANCHRTLFTSAATIHRLEEPTNRLLRFIEGVLASFPPTSAFRGSVMTELVRRSSWMLVVESVALSPGLYSEVYCSELQHYSPLAFSCIRSLREQMQSKRSRLTTMLKNRRFAKVASAHI